MSILPNLIYRFQELLIKVLMANYTDLEKPIQEFTGDQKVTNNQEIIFLYLYLWKEFFKLSFVGRNDAVASSQFCFIYFKNLM